ncbi:hypothetical protein AtNW77_Chr5g0141861 [Arabidopsis thaliana]|jgi:hypothetical protein|uniref:Hapless 8 n=3 Tax=Arabidopsis thaliana TaxID=3702 RepID=A0A178UR96_ARATH|nr:hapless protein [Arabidopsis thaliana]AED96738.1 hapless protein [Arabidopsis thaliana]OAO95211.1 hypothetical protein AXX17_AT5G55410 [Arabidopsis thaliana]|eukprot:NP_200435.3 hapless protein [Arabidopsis thaliana]
MFLSTENPPNDPLSSSSSPFLQHLTSSSHELGQSHLSNFSIRDYAYSNRKNNIKNNWPFSSKSLQLFSTHGVTNPLPPFQKFSTVSSKFETTASPSSGKQIVSSYVHQGRDLDLAKLGLNQTVAETSSKGVCSQSRIIENGLFPSTSVSKSEVEILVATTSNKKDNHSRKCGRGMVKSKEDSCAGLVTTSESIMASKTCPICKTFSSASNTTLNAHIDQCLSVDSALLPPVVFSKPNKPRSKPPRVKVKTMVDIYASAKQGTLEDLDRRNGTKWVSILSYSNRVVADKSEVSKKRKVSPVGVGPVYIDAKGQKLRILSGFSEKKSSTTPLREQHEDGSSDKKCLGQGSKGTNKSLRKIRRGKKPHKFVKLTNHKADGPEIRGVQRGFSGEGSHMGHHRRIYNQRMLAKRGLVSKKLNEKGHELSEDDEDTWSGGDPTVLRGTDLSATDSYPLKKQKLGSEVAGRKKTLFRSQSAQSRSFRVPQSEKEDESLEGVNINRLKKSVASFQEDKYPPGKKFCSDASPRGTSMRKFSPPFVPNAWRRLSMPVELKKARLDFSEEKDDEETGKWESEMTHERELRDDDYVSGDDGENNEVLLRSNPSSSGYDDYNDDDEESSEEEGDNNKRAHVLDQTDYTGAEFYQSESDSPTSIEILPSERAMYYSEAGNMIYGQTSCKEDERFDSEVGQGSLFVEVDTIPIPGPPGSFLPSPRDMGFDENLGNSSVITSQVQSSMDQLDRNSSESPVSAVSNFAAGRLNFPAELSSFRENFSPDIAMSYSTTPMSFCVPSHHGTITEAEPITIDKTISPSRFRNNDQESCCCQRKERISEGITLNHQGSHLLQRRAASSSNTMNLTNSPTRLDPNHPFEQSPYKTQQALDLQMSKFSSRKSLNAVVPPSPSNPVLRLMGKDLMVMNQGEADEEASRSSLTPNPQFVDPPCGGTGLYFNTGLYLRNSFDSTHQPQVQAQQQSQAAAFRNNFDHVRYFSPS